MQKSKNALQNKRLYKEKKMNNANQIETVKKVLGLEKYVAETSHALSKLQAEKFKQAPNSPTREIIQRTYPKVVSQMKFNWKEACIPAIVSTILMFVDVIFILLFFPALMWIPAYYFIVHRKKKKEDIERIQNSDEYKAKCKKLDEKFDRQQEAADKKYEDEKKIYETETLPAYQKAFETWSVQQNEKISQVKSDLKNAQNQLNYIYETTKIVPIQYRKIEILQYIYDLISTSDYDVKQAIEVYDRNEQRKLDAARLYEQQQANQLANEQNDLLYEQNKIVDKARRDANKAAVVGAIQRHNTNKTLKSFKKK